MSDNGAAEFPFDMSPDENRIVSHFKTASLILGRSGTGKTTCLVFKLLAKYQSARSTPGGGAIRQASDFHLMTHAKLTLDYRYYLRDQLISQVN